MNEIGGNYFDGETSRSLGVVLRLCRDGRIDIEGSGFEYHTHVRDVRVSHRLGSTPRAIYLGNNSKVEVLDNDAIDAFLETQGLDRSWRWVSRIERAPLLIGLALVLTVSCIYVFVEYGLPVLARHIAESIPQEVEDGMSNTALEFLDTHVFQLSNLPAARQGELRDLFSGLTETTLPDRPLRFEFRRSDFIGPNAFALPSGIVVFTDALVDLAADDRELVAVMAHEVGHVVQRHSLRHLLQNFRHRTSHRVRNGRFRFSLWIGSHITHRHVGVEVLSRVRDGGG